MLVYLRIQVENVFICMYFRVKVVNVCIFQSSSGKVTIITAVAKKKTDPTVQKGELMLNNTDLMEVRRLYYSWSCLYFVKDYFITTATLIMNLWSIQYFLNLFT